MLTHRRIIAIAVLSIIDPTRIKKTYKKDKLKSL